MEVLGRQFATDNAPTLTRKALDARRNDQGQAHVVIHDLDDAVTASQIAIPYGNIETDLVTRLMATNGITATIAEANAALGIARDVRAVAIEGAVRVDRIPDHSLRASHALIFRGT